MQKCKKCLETKEETEFYSSYENKRLRLRKVCKDCTTANRTDDYKIKRKDGRYRRMYGISLNEVNAMSEAQGHQCAICKIDAVHVEYGQLVVDHDHDSGEVRELLCKKCNQGIGLLMDNSDFCDAAGSYLRKHGK